MPLTHNYLQFQDQADPAPPLHGKTLHLSLSALLCMYINQHVTLCAITMRVCDHMRVFLLVNMLVVFKMLPL